MVKRADMEGRVSWMIADPSPERVTLALNPGMALSAAAASSRISRAAS